MGGCERIYCIKEVSIMDSRELLLSLIQETNERLQLAGDKLEELFNLIERKTDILTKYPDVAKEIRRCSIQICNAKKYARSLESSMRFLSDDADLRINSMEGG